MGIRRVVTAVALAAVVAAGALAPVPSPSVPPPAGADPAGRYLERVFANVTVTRDIVYGAARDEHGAVQQLHLDLYEPTGDTLAARPVVLLAHGGSFVSGSKANLASWGNAYARRGFVAASIEYRMHEGAGPVSFPPSAAGIARILEAKHDMQAAVRWVRTHGAAHRLDPGRVAVGGSSAGAVTAVLVATTPDDPGTSGHPGVSSAVCTAVSVAGAGEPAFVDADDAGAIFFHGEADTTVPYSQAVVTEAAMRNAGLPSRLVSFPGLGHGLGGVDATIEAQAAAWLHEQVVLRPTGCAGSATPASGAFVRAAYQDFLGRAPTGEELAQHVTWLDGGGSRPVLLRALTTSDEWLGALVTGLYAETLGRAPDTTGLAHWVGALRSGQRTVAQVAAHFYASAEFFQRSGGDATDWVTELYRMILGRAPDPAGLAHWTGQAAARGRGAVAGPLYGSVESRRTRVGALYRHLLGRAPDAPGRAYWVDRVAREGDLALARQLAASAEYRQRAVARFP